MHIKGLNLYIRSICVIRYDKKRGYKQPKWFPSGHGT